ncbi:MAG: response regulator transcription factor [Planctomycetota bacterium]
MSSAPSILVVEDDAAIRRGIVDALTYSKYEVVECGDGEAGLERALGGGFDLLLLDVMLPGIDGFEVLRALRRERSPLPVILITARGAEDDRVEGLRGGADDYVVKPFSARELLARVEAVLRRVPQRPAAIRGVVSDGIKVDLERREARLADETAVPLSEKEAELITYLAVHPDRAISRDELLQRVWGLDPRGVTTRTIDMHIARLREKLGDDPNAPSFVTTVRGKGYMLSRQAEVTP